MQETKYLYRGIWLPLVTPFRNGEVDYVALRQLVSHYRCSGLTGLVVCGTTGEAAALDETEQLAVLDTVLTEAGDLPVMMGLAGNNLRHVLSRLATIGERPLAGVLVPAPYYIRPSQEGLKAYFRALADRSQAPLVLYDIPYRTGVTLSAETLLSLADHGNIRGIKDCGGNAETTRALIADGRLAVLAGEDQQLLATLCMGGQGAILASAHIRPDLFSALWRAVADQRLHVARDLFHALMPMIRLMFAEPNPGPVKALLAGYGLMSDELRLPMTPISTELARQLAIVREALDLVEADAL
ncbi:4-hydroxy-tetrahydrodipicolinate synthase [Pigmentiphaga aceris]|uniref:4-hydroxy-tetrahydrodipicolinate synthase n=1 Tax=Pigmentiphaga aceris TaxID=1940612 RepID=A0A5C0AWR5_9BURK|nr:4-hydroxy-tetrahydrodipicolinate synthase [Pigmentiphaga aceris]QEI06206.1 4-hydroxy-tetrahydrodipicolinate synthase [Pigmentiphaga aceris]